MKIPPQAVEIIKHFEGFVPHTYTDTVGVPSIGYGTTAAAGVGIVPVPGMEISERQAEKYLVAALEKFAKKIEPHIKAEMNENEWAAFLSLAYNIGPFAFSTSTALRRFNEGDKLGAADAILWFNKAGSRTLRGLVRRRHAERALFLRPVERTPRWLRLWRKVKGLVG